MVLQFYTILPGQSVATVAAHHLPELSEPSQREVFTKQMGHPVDECFERTVKIQLNCGPGVEVGLVLVLDPPLDLLVVVDLTAVGQALK